MSHSRLEQYSKIGLRATALVLVYSAGRTPLSQTLSKSRREIELCLFLMLGLYMSILAEWTDNYTNAPTARQKQAWRRDGAIVHLLAAIAWIALATNAYRSWGSGFEWPVGLACFGAALSVHQGVMFIRLHQYHAALSND